MSESVSETRAAVLTGKGTAALATLQLYGSHAAQLIHSVFRSVSSQPATLDPGSILLGTIHDDGQSIDQVTVGCEDRNLFAIHCHGNPLIVEQIMELLQRHGATLLPAEQLLTDLWMDRGRLSAIAIEAKLILPRAMTLLGTRLLHHQIEGGLSRKITSWQERRARDDLPALQGECRELLAQRLPVKYLIHGCTVVLAGPPNSGKSTLLNCLCGQDAAVVTDVQGTTRDWIESPCHLGSLYVTVIDTAGLDPEIIDHAIDRQAQEQTLAVLKRADLVLLVLDNSRSSVKIHPSLLETIGQRPLLPVFNKSDLPPRLDRGKLPCELRGGIPVSARNNEGVAALIANIEAELGVKGIDAKTAVCFTERQEALLLQLQSAESSDEAEELIRRLGWDGGDDGGDRLRPTLGPL